MKLLDQIRSGSPRLQKASPLIDAVGVAERTLDNGSAPTPRAQAVQDALVAEHMTAPTHIK